MKDAKKKEVQDIVKEIKENGLRFNTPEMPRFVTIMTADGYASRKDYNQAIDLLNKYLNENPMERKEELLSRRIVDYINLDINNKLTKEDYLNVIKTYDEYANSWLKSANRLDAKLALASSLDTLGAKDKAEEYYKSIINYVYSIQNTKEATDLEARGILPSADKINLKLAKIYFDKKNNHDAYSYLKNIKKPEDLSVEEQIERVQLFSKVFEERGDYSSSARYLRELILNWRGQPEKLTQVYYDLAEINLKEGKKTEALDSLQLVEGFYKDEKVNDDVRLLKVLQMEVEILADLKDYNKYKTKASELLEKFEDKYPLASLRYKLGEVYFKEGELKKASEIWDGYKGKDTQFWSSLSQEKLKEAKWNDDYKKYLKRIPAMSQAESGGQ